MTRFIFQGNGLPFQEPATVASRDGSNTLHMTLEVDVGEVTVDWLTTKRRLYNGTIPAPTVRVKPGEKWHLHLVSMSPV